MICKNFSEKGGSLLEILLTLVITILIIMTSVRYYAQYKRTKEVALFQASVVELMNGLDQYYYMSCRDNSNGFPNVSIQQLQNLGLVRNNYNNNSWAVFNVQIIGDSNTKFYRLRVVATVEDSISRANYLRGALNADNEGIDTPRIIWTRLPIYTRDDLGSRQWIMNQGPGQVWMPRRYMTAVNEDRSSGLWILNGGLQAFKKTQEVNNPC